MIAEETREELVAILSEMHLSHSTDVETLCGDTFHKFDAKHPRFNDVPALQPRLFELCKSEFGF